MSFTASLIISLFHFPGIFCTRYSGQKPSRGQGLNISCDSTDDDPIIFLRLSATER